MDDTFLIVFHASPEPCQLTLPEAKWGKVWCRVLDTERGFAGDCADGDRLEAGARLEVLPRSLWVLRRES